MTMDASNVLGLDTIKEHLRIPATQIEEDLLLNVFCGAAAEYVKAVTGCNWEEEYVVPFSVKAAMLLVVADLYEHREAQTAAPLKENETVMRLLWPHRRWC
jgi:hypothetical protein